MVITVMDAMQAITKLYELHDMQNSMTKFKVSMGFSRMLNPLSFKPHALEEGHL